MKANFLRVILLMVILVMGSCGNSIESPESVTEKFLRHYYKKEYAEAEKYISEDNKETFAALRNRSKSKLIKAEEPEISDMKCEVEDDAAVCTCMVNGNEERIELRLVEDKWMIDNPKESQNRHPSKHHHHNDEVVHADTLEFEAN